MEKEIKLSKGKLTYYGNLINKFETTPIKTKEEEIECINMLKNLLDDKDEDIPFEGKVVLVHRLISFMNFDNDYVFSA